jgi:integrase
VGRWREFTLVGGMLKRKQRSTVLGPCSEMSKGDAERKMLDILQPVNDGTHTPMQTMGFDEFCARWERDISPHYRDSTRTFYKATLGRWILPYFQNWRLDEVTTPEVQRFINQFASYSGSVVRHIRATLSVLMATAVNWQYIPRNPVSGVRLPPGKPVKRAPVLRPEQVRLVLTNLEEPYRTMATLMAGTVIRESELLALKWSDFESTQQVIRIRRSLYRSKIHEGTKTDASCRDIPYADNVAGAVWGLANSQHNRGEYLFLTERGKIYDPRVVERCGFEPLIARLGLPKFTWRSFRRSAATVLHENGTPLKVQQEIMGHANPEMSLLYTETAMAARRQAIEGLERLLFPTVPKLTSTQQAGQPN